MSKIMENVNSPVILEDVAKDDAVSYIKLTGDWHIRNLAGNKQLQHQLKLMGQHKNKHWRLDSIQILDNAAALMIWLAWNKTMPPSIDIKPEHRNIFQRWQAQQIIDDRRKDNIFNTLGLHITLILRELVGQFGDFVVLAGQFVLDILYLLMHPSQIPWGEISITIYESGVRALGITALVGFLIGIVLSYLSALQLKLFGAEIYIIDILGLSIIRELGPLLTAILVAGRSGSAMTAQIGIMRVTEELDALSAMGISHSLRLILPKVIALVLVLPMLSIWTNAAALIGGMVSAENTLDISYEQFFQKLPDTVPLVNVFIGLGKSAAFGFMISLIACHFGFRIKPNTESLGNETTNSVVAAITVVIMVDALFAILFMNVGMP
jgi:phospholipid/cholesterol/gamma-HCH transport system permease protein